MTWIRSQWQWHIIDPDDKKDDEWPRVLCLDFEPPEHGQRHTREAEPAVDEQCIECVREQDWRRENP